MRKGLEAKENVAKDFKVLGYVWGLEEGIAGEEAGERRGVQLCRFYANKFILYFIGQEEQLRGFKQKSDTIR